MIENIYKKYFEKLEKDKKIDFDDMINYSVEYIKKIGFDKNLEYLNYDYILVDEYQDISFTRNLFIKTLQKESGAKVVVVGDDWQSIYRFAGSEVSLFKEFNKDFKNSIQLRIEKTYRNSQNLINVASKFIQKNHHQIKKNMESARDNIEKPIKIYHENNNAEEVVNQIIKDIIDEFPDGKIAILQRNNFDIKYILKDTKNLKVDKDGKPISYKIRGKEISCKTIHRSKGLEYDNVILINLNNTINGLPNKKEDDPIIHLLIGYEDQEFSEERRLFYVALTRTENNVYMIVPENNKSDFVTEILNDSKKHIEIVKENSIKNNPKCLYCNEGVLIERTSSKTGEKFLSCDYFPLCDFKVINTEVLEKTAICKQCKRGYLHEKKNWTFISCSNCNQDLKGAKSLDDLIFCPKCGEGYLPKKYIKNGKFHYCNHKFNPKKLK